MVKLELTEDFLHLKKGDVIERSQSIASIHIHYLKNAKVYKPRRKKKTEK